MIAGEASGDLHGSNLMRGLYARDPQADIRFWGGGLMDAVYQEHQAGSGLVRDYREGAVMGIWEVFVQARKLLARVRSCEEDIAAWKPDVVILIDYPGFNFRIAEYAHNAGFKVFWYIAPKVWASREKRIKKVCMKCQHYSGSYYKGDGHCNYILDTGRSRPCSYVDCVEAGVFLPKSRKKGWTAKGGRFLGP